MMKALSLFTLVFTLALTPVFAQVNYLDNGDKDKKNDAQRAEASITPAEQAERDMLVPRKYQEQLAVEASKPVKYGPTYSGRKSYSKKSSSRRKYYGKKRTTSGKGRTTKTSSVKRRR
jgi:hypothetical protein